MVGHFLTLFERDSASVLQIALITNKNACDVILGELLNFAHPCVDCIERVAVSDVVNDNDTVSALVVAGSDGLETLLARGVPNLELADFLVDINRADLEVNANRWHEVFLELIILNIEVKASKSTSFF